MYSNSTTKFNISYKSNELMGTKMAPAYANLYMGKLEEKLKDLGKSHKIMEMIH